MNASAPISIERVAIGSILPDPQNLRDRIDFVHVEDLADGMRVQGFDPSFPLRIVEIDARAYADRLKAVPEREWVWRAEELLEFFRNRAELDQVRAQGRKSSWAAGGTFGKYRMLVDGEHRLRAARRAGLSDVYAILRQHADEASLVREQLSANRARPASPREMLQGLIRLKRAGSSKDDAKKAVGKNQTWLDNRWDLIDVVPDEVLEEVERKLSVSETQELASVYRFVGSKYLPTKSEADRVVRGIFGDYLDAFEKQNAKPIGYIARRVEDAKKDFGGQAFLLEAVAPVPSEGELASGAIGGAIERFRESAARLISGVRPAFERWASDPANAKKSFEEFVRESGLRRHANVKQILDDLRITRDQTVKLLMDLCARGTQHEVCAALATAKTQGPVAKKVTPARKISPAVLKARAAARELAARRMRAAGRLNDGVYEEAGSLLSLKVLRGCKVEDVGEPGMRLFVNRKRGKLLVLDTLTKLNKIPDAARFSGAGRVLAISYGFGRGNFTHIFDKQYPTFYRAAKGPVVFCATGVRWTRDRGFA